MTKVQKIGLFAVIAAIFGVVQPLAYAALPPLSSAEQRKRADVIIEGRILDIQTAVTTGPVGDNNTFTAHVLITKVRKGKHLSKGKTAIVRWWTIHLRPEGWVGPSGQYAAPQKGDKRTLFLRTDVKGDKGTFDLLEPNGSTLILSSQKKQ